MKNIKLFIENTYSKYWIRKREKILPYDQNLINLIENIDMSNYRIIEVGIGTGYPFGEHFSMKGFDVHGIDISPILVEYCKKKYPQIIVNIGDAENINYNDNEFDLVYCFHSTWYFPDLLKAIIEMIRVAKSGGTILFDIQNALNESITKIYEKRLSESSGIKKIFRIIKNLIKVAIRKGIPDWTDQPYWQPSDPNQIINFLNNVNISYYKIYFKDNNNCIYLLKNINDLNKYPRLIFLINK